MEPVVLEAGPEVGPRRAPMGPCPHVLALGIQCRRAAERLLDAVGWNKPQPDQYPTGAELVEQYLEPLATRTALKDRIRTASRVTGVGRVGFDKVKTKGRDGSALRDPLPERQGPRDAAGRCGDRRHGHVVLAQPGRRRRPAGDRRRAEARERIAYGMPDVLGRDRARYAGKTVAVLGAGHSAIGTLIDLARLKDEVPATEIDLAAARRHAGKGVRRRRQRQARRARRAGCGLRRPGGGRQDQGRDGLPGFPPQPRRRTPARSAPARPAAAATSPSTSWWSPPASGPSSISCAKSGSRSIRRSNARRRWRR